LTGDLPVVITQASLSASGLLASIVAKLGRTPTIRRSRNLIGDNYLLDTLRLQSRRPLYSRIALSCQLSNLTPPQTQEYLAHGIEQAGLQRSCFEPAAIDMLAAASDGNPRTLNLLARAAWVEASRQQATTINAQHVQRALRLVPAARDKIGLPLPE
jgi:hypothetical protein